MKIHKERIRALSQKSRPSYGMAISPRSQKKTVEELKSKLNKKNVEPPYQFIDFPTDYPYKDTKGYKTTKLTNNTNINANQHQAFLNTTIYKLDKDIVMNMNNNLPQNCDNETKPEQGHGKRFNSFLHIKSVTFSNQNPTILKKWYQLTKNSPVLVYAQEKDWLKNYHINLQYLSDTDENYHKKTRVRISYSAQKSRDHKIKYLNDSDTNFRVISENSEANLLQSRSIQDPLNSSSSLLNTSIIHSANNSANTTINNNSGLCITNSKPILAAPTIMHGERRILNHIKDRASLSPNKFGPLEQIKEVSYKRPVNVHQIQKSNGGNCCKTLSYANGSANLTTNESKGGNQIGSVLQSQSINANNIPFNSMKNQQSLQSRQLMLSQGDKKKMGNTPAPITNYKYYVGPGNNGDLVRRVMSKREWWEECEQYNSSFNFKWHQSNKGYKYDKLIAGSAIKQIVNHFEYHKEISTKNMLIKNLAVYCEQNKLNLFDITPTTFVLDMDDDVNFENDMQIFAKLFISNSSNPNEYQKPEKSKNPHIVYPFEFKKRRTNQTQFGIDKQLSEYIRPKMHSTFNKGFNVWLLKPTGYNRGRGIEVFNTLETLNQYVNEFFDGFVELGPNERRSKMNDSGSEESEEEESDGENKKKPKRPIIKSHTFVLQKYVESPLLIHSRKFDIRVWALVTHEMNLYFFKEGYLRLSSEIFTLNEDNIDNKFVHLTNNAVQKFSENYGELENGNQLSFEGFEKYIADHNLRGDFRGKILPRMKELVSISMNSVKKNMDLNDRKYCFEIFGYDFFIDSDFTVWLIEVNTNPCIEESSPLLEELLPRMLDDAFKMTLDVLFPEIKKPDLDQSTQNIIQDNLKAMKHNHMQGKRLRIHSETVSQNSSISSENGTARDIPYSVKGYKDDESMWEFLCSLQVPRSPTKKPTNASSAISKKQDFQ